MNAENIATEFRRLYRKKQRTLLVWLAECWDQLETQAQRGDQPSADWLTWGIPLQPQHPADRRANASSRAALSRRLRRLDEQGLVERVRENGRTYALKLTPLGREVARRVNGGAAAVNRSS